MALCCQSRLCRHVNNCSKNFESSAFNDVVTNLCESMSEVNAVKYVAGYAIKRVLNSHKCVECISSYSIQSLCQNQVLMYSFTSNCLNTAICLVFMCHLMLRYIFSQNVGTSLRKNKCREVVVWEPCMPSFV